MESELRRILHDAAARPCESPSLDEVRSRGRRMRRARIVSMLAAAIVATSLVVGSTFFYLVYTPKGVSSGPGSMEGKPSYNISNFEIKYPYVNDHPFKRQWRKVGVGFQYAWASGAYPGWAECHVVIEDRNGTRSRGGVGLDSEQPSGRVDPDNVPVDVEEHQGPYEVVKAGCGRSTYEDGSGYEVEGPISKKSTVDPKTGGTVTRFVFLVGWNEHRHPSSRTCRLEVVLVDGTRRIRPMGTISLGGDTNPIRLPVTYPMPPDRIKEAHYVCHPIRDGLPPSDGVDGPNASGR